MFSFKEEIIRLNISTVENQGLEHSKCLIDMHWINEGIKNKEYNAEEEKKLRTSRKPVLQRWTVTL